MKNNSLHIKKDGRIFQMLSGFTNVTKINRRYIMKYKLSYYILSAVFYIMLLTFMLFVICEIARGSFVTTSWGN